MGNSLARSPDQFDGFLRYIAQAVSLGEDETEGLRERMSLRRIDAGEAWIREGERCNDIAFVASGVLRVYFLDDGDDVTAYFATEGQTVSDYESFLTGAPAGMTTEAVEDAALVILGRDAVEWAYRTLSHGERLGRVIAERLFLATHARLASFYLDSAEERYTRLMAEHPGLLQRVPQHMIASYVGVRPQSLSRIRRRIAEG